MEAKIINLNEWESFGGGGYGESFNNKTDDSVILKLNKPSVSEEKAREEFIRSKAVFDMGIPSAEPYEFVTDGKRFGMTVQRIKGKQSFGRIIADSPERLEELACLTADYAKALHSIPCNTEVFGSESLHSRQMIQSCEIIPDDIKERLSGYIDELEPATTCLHGDLNPCNIITAEGKVYWIDLGDFGYGDPLLDFSILSHMGSWGPAPMVKYLFHIDRKQLWQFYQAMGRQYFGPRWGSPELKERLDHIAQIMAAKAICLWPDSYRVNIPYLLGNQSEAEANLSIADSIQMK